MVQIKLEYDSTDPVFPLQTYHRDRVEANVRRKITERLAAGAGSPTAIAPGDNSSSAAVLHENSVPSAFEYVNYPMPETTAQENVQGLQIGRYMTDPGISADGPSVDDIAHLPPRHAGLSPPRALVRSNRDVLLSREDHVTAGRVNVESLARPRVPRDVIDQQGELYVYQHHKNKGRDPIERSNLIARQGPDFHVAHRDIQETVGITNPDSMDLIEVQHAAKDIDFAMQLNDSAYSHQIILPVLWDLRKNWSPNARILQDTGVGHLVNILRDSDNPDIATLAAELNRYWRRTIRSEPGHNATQTMGFQLQDDGQTIRTNFLNSELAQRRQACLDYSKQVARAIRQRQGDEEKEIHRQRAAQSSGVPIDDPDTNSNDAEHHNIGNNGDDNQISSDNGNFNILEISPSPQRDQTHTPGQDNRHAEDGPLESIEQPQTVGPCYACPDFPGTYHHACAPENPQCLTLLVTTRHPPGRNDPNDRSPDYAPSRSPQQPRQNDKRWIQMGRPALEQATRLGEAFGARQPLGADLLNQNDTYINNTGRTPHPGRRPRFTEPIWDHPQLHPTQVPEALANLSAPSNARRPSGLTPRIHQASGRWSPASPENGEPIAKRLRSSTRNTYTK